jgi:dTDP-4-amino-4,6-dideoxygalactose transaminase
LIFSHDDILRTFGPYYQKCHQFLLKQYKAEEVILTPSCTSALELAAESIGIVSGDEILMPSYTYVSTANAFIRSGGTPVFIDSENDSPNMDINDLRNKITNKSKAVVIVHYAGISVDMVALKAICKKHQLVLIEDAAHAIDAKYNQNLLGAFGDLSTLSFHETKNISCGQGGALIINSKKYVESSRIKAQCGTDRFDFMRKKVNAYTWKSIGMNALLSEPSCAMLQYQLKEKGKILKKRKTIWKRYHSAFLPLENADKVIIPKLTKFNHPNGHIFYLKTKSKNERDQLINFLKEQGIQATFHYQCLHKSLFFKKQYFSEKLKNAEIFESTLIRLPLYYSLSEEEQLYVIQMVNKFYGA